MSPPTCPTAARRWPPRARYEWRVRTWDSAGTGSEWSAPASFEVELAEADWAASWIGLGPVREHFTPPDQPGRPDAVAAALRPAPYLRHSFTLAGPVASARLRVTALGLYEARLNGRRVGDGFLTPGWTDYGQRVLYQAYDVTGLLREGENVLGAVLGDGWYSGFVGFDAKRAGAHYGQAAELLAQLEVAFADGTTALVVTDDAWQGRFAAIRHADLLMGERHDLRLEPPAGTRPASTQPLPRRPAGAPCGNARATAGCSPPTPACRSASPRKSPRSSVTRTRGGRRACSTSGRT